MGGTIDSVRAIKWRCGMDGIAETLVSSMANSEFKHLNGLIKHLGNAIPNAQLHGDQLKILVEKTASTGAPHVLDLGCGSGRSSEEFKAINHNAQWAGVDIVERSTCEGIDIRLYDGVNLPFDDASLDVVYSKQVFEHVRHPEPLLREITRTLKPGGHFIGSVSCMEPFHLNSIFGYTAYGWKVITEDAGLPLQFIAAGADAPSLIHWHMARSKQVPFSAARLRNAISDTHGALHWRRKNAIELLFAGHLVFHCAKPA